MAWTWEKTDDPYKQQTNDAIMPYWNKARNEMKANLADQGLLSSTAGQRRYQNEVELPFASAANTMYGDLKKQQRAEQFQQQQANVSNATNLYNLLWSAYLNQWQLKGTNQGITAPKDFPVFQGVYNSQYQQPGYAYGQMGDASTENTEYVPRYQPAVSKTLEARNVDADNAYKAAYLKLAQEQAARDAEQMAWERGQVDDAANPKSFVESGNDWGQVTEYALSLAAGGVDPEAAILATLNKYRLPIAVWLDEESPMAVNFIRSVFGTQNREAADEFIAKMRTQPSAAAAAATSQTGGGNFGSKQGFWNSPGALATPLWPIAAAKQLNEGYVSDYYGRPSNSALGSVGQKVVKPLSSWLAKLLGY